MMSEAKDVKETYPENPAPADYAIAELIDRRWSPRLFEEGREVEREKVLSLLEAARWAPSCFNDQPWYYLIFDGSNPNALATAHECLVEGNAWARQAPLLLLSVARENFAHNGKPNRHAQHDVGAASAYLVLQAVELGLVAHQMAGYDAERAQLEFQIPEDHMPMAMMAIGYPYRGNLDELDEKTQQRELAPRARRDTKNTAFAGKWGEAYRE
jgi:nitroreductase